MGLHTWIRGNRPKPTPPTSSDFFTILKRGRMITISFRFTIHIVVINRDYDSAYLRTRGRLPAAVSSSVKMYRLFWFGENREEA